MKQNTKNVVIFLSKMFFLLGGIIFVTIFSYIHGFYDALEKNIDAKECKPLRKITQISDIL